jgi:hypothetical protein
MEALFFILLLPKSKSLSDFKMRNTFRSIMMLAIVKQSSSMEFLVRFHMIKRVHKMEFLVIFCCGGVINPMLMFYCF